MRKYYIFNIKEEFHTLKYETKLYQVLKNIYNLKKPYLNYGISLYNQLCISVNTEVLINYVSNKYSTDYKEEFLLQNKRSNEKVYIKIKPSCIILITNHNFSPLFRIFYLYSKNLFVCDFDNNDYFWLADVYRKGKNHIFNYNA